MSKRFEGKRVLITGATRGIGLAGAEGIAHEQGDLILTAQTSNDWSNCVSDSRTHMSSPRTPATRTRERPWRRPLLTVEDWTDCG